MQNYKCEESLIKLKRDMNDRRMELEKQIEEVIEEEVSSENLSD